MTGWEHQYRPLFIPFMGYGIYLLVCHVFILFGATGMVGGRFFIGVDVDGGPEGRRFEL